MASETISQSEMTQEVVRLLLEGNSMSDVIEYMKSITPDLSTEEAAQWAFDKFEDAANMPQQARVGWCIEAYRELYRRMLEVGDFNGAVRCVIETGKLAGKKEAQKKKSSNLKTEEEQWKEEIRKAYS